MTVSQLSALLKDSTKLHHTFTTTVAEAAATRAALNSMTAAVVAYRQPIIADVPRFVAQQWLPHVNALAYARNLVPKWITQQNAILRSVATMARPWWTDLTLWPTEPVMISALRQFDAVRTQLYEMSRTVESALGAVRSISRLSADVWAELRRARRRVIFWAVQSAHDALQRGDFRAIGQFAQDWLDAAPTQFQVEAAVEALLEINLTSYSLDEGARLLADLRARYWMLRQDRRREHELLLGKRIRGTHIGRFVDPETTELALPGPSLEDHVLNQLQPDVDPRLIEFINQLPPPTRRS